MDPDSTLTLAEALDLLPKVELHCHVEGTMRPETLVELAASSGHALGTTEPRQLYRYDSLDGFLKVFWLAQSCLTKRDDWARLAHESVVDGAAHGLVYRESFFTPARHLASGQDLEGFDTMAAIAQAGVDAAWLTASEKAALRSRISTAALELASSIGSSGVSGPEGMDARSS